MGLSQFFLSKFIHYFYSGRKWFGRKWRLSRHIREIGSDKKSDFAKKFRIDLLIPMGVALYVGANKIKQNLSQKSPKVNNLPQQRKYFQSGTRVMILKIFSPKVWRKYWRFLLSLCTASLCIKN
jgi:hypothetical protein